MRNSKLHHSVEKSWVLYFCLSFLCKSKTSRGFSAEGYWRPSSVLTTLPKSKFWKIIQILREINFIGESLVSKTTILTIYCEKSELETLNPLLHKLRQMSTVEYTAWKFRNIPSSDFTWNQFWLNSEGQKLPYIVIILDSKNNQNDAFR